MYEDCVQGSHDETGAFEVLDEIDTSRDMFSCLMVLEEYY